MNTPITVTPYGILISLLILTGFVALVFLVICLYKVIRILGKVNKFVDANSAPVTASIQKLPEIAENVSVVTKNLTGVTESAGEILDGLDGITSENDGGIVGTITMIASLVQNVIQVIRNIANKDE